MLNSKLFIKIICFINLITNSLFILVFLDAKKSHFLPDSSQLLSYLLLLLVSYPYHFNHIFQQMRHLLH